MLSLENSTLARRQPGSSQLASIFPLHVGFKGKLPLQCCCFPRDLSIWRLVNFELQRPLQRLAYHKFRD